ncbi:helix-turn-helix domain-containing protein [Pseudomonas sp. GTC 16481]|uniref:helix-turn-helix domain-containing protein n=1 Tax=Pseudomonas sp. GTC 16481 TaxID=1661061 RepID=UPI0009F28F5C|nr:helix-turn-helix domain-containing protein [Pseudomonas sp. GTC 16481]
MTTETIADADLPDNHSTAAQAKRMIAALRQGPVSSIEAAQKLDIVHPPSTIRHLRRKGWGILTQWCYQAAGPGLPPHRVGQYVLTKEID